LNACAKKPGTECGTGQWRLSMRNDCVFRAFLWSTDHLPIRRQPKIQLRQCSVWLQDTAEWFMDFPMTLAPRQPPQCNLVEDIHGIKMPDPFRPLEDRSAAFVQTWVNEQTKRTREFI
jgi:hypothetical protein